MRMGLNAYVRIQYRLVFSKYFMSCICDIDAAVIATDDWIQSSNGNNRLCDEI